MDGNFNDDVGSGTKVDVGLPRSSKIPTAILDQDLIADTSLAYDCFVSQKFSGKLQVFLIGYVNSIYSNYSVYK